MEGSEEQYRQGSIATARNRKGVLRMKKGSRFLAIGLVAATIAYLATILWFIDRAFEEKEEKE